MWEICGMKAAKVTQNGNFSFLFQRDAMSTHSFGTPIPIGELSGAYSGKDVWRGLQGRLLKMVTLNCSSR